MNPESAVGSLPERFLTVGLYRQRWEQAAVLGHRVRVSFHIPWASLQPLRGGVLLLPSRVSEEIVNVSTMDAEAWVLQTQSSEPQFCTYPSFAASMTLRFKDLFDTQSPRVYSGDDNTYLLGLWQQNSFTLLTNTVHASQKCLFCQVVNKQWTQTICVQTPALLSTEIINRRTSWASLCRISLFRKGGQL